MGFLNRPHSSSPGFLLLGTFTKHLLFFAPEELGTGHRSYCCFFSPGGLFLFLLGDGSLEGWHFPAAGHSRPGLRRAWLTHLLCCEAGQELSPAAALPDRVRACGLLASPSCGPRRSQVHQSPPGASALREVGGRWLSTCCLFTAPLKTHLKARGRRWGGHSQFLTRDQRPSTQGCPRGRSRPVYCPWVHFFPPSCLRAQ